MRVALCSLPLLWCLFGAVTSPTSAQPATIAAAEAAYQSGLALDGGKGVPKNPAQAIEQYRKAAAQGHVLAQLALGQRYYRGEGVTKDFTEAVKWFRKAAEAGNAKAQFNLAICLETGEGVTKSVPQAMRWYEKAATAGDAMAQFNLGINYWRGDGVAQDKNEGLKWFMLAADQGNPKAQLVVGRMYASGSGLPKNPNLARRMLQSAADQGNEQAKAELTKLNGGGANPSLDQARSAGPRDGTSPSSATTRVDSPTAPREPRESLFSGQTGRQPPGDKVNAQTAAATQPPSPTSTTAVTLTQAAGSSDALAETPALRAGGSQTGTAPAAEVPPFLDVNRVTPAQFAGAVSFAMEAMRLVYGELTPEQEKQFEAKWRPLFQFCTPQVVEYFNKLNPLLGQFLQIRSALSAVATAFDEAQQAAIAAVALESAEELARAMDEAELARREMASLTIALEKVVAAIVALGDPPEVEQAAHRRRKAHEDAMRMKPSEGANVKLTWREPPECWHETGSSYTSRVKAGGYLPIETDADRHMILDHPRTYLSFRTEENVANYAAQGFADVRINFETGAYPENLDEVEDAIALESWTQPDDSVAPAEKQRLMRVGYFGSFVGSTMKVAPAQPRVERTRLFNFPAVRAEMVRVREPGKDDLWDAVHEQIVWYAVDVGLLQKGAWLNVKISYNMSQKFVRPSDAAEATPVAEAYLAFAKRRAPARWKAMQEIWDREAWQVLDSLDVSLTDESASADRARFTAGNHGIPEAVQAARDRRHDATGRFVYVGATIPQAAITLTSTQFMTCAVQPRGRASAGVRIRSEHRWTDPPDVIALGSPCMIAVDCPSVTYTLIDDAEYIASYENDDARKPVWKKLTAGTRFADKDLSGSDDYAAFTIVKVDAAGGPKAISVRPVPVSAKTSASTWRKECTFTLNEPQQWLYIHFTAALGSEAPEVFKFRSSECDWATACYLWDWTPTRTGASGSVVSAVADAAAKPKPPTEEVRAEQQGKLDQIEFYRAEIKVREDGLAALQRQLASARPADREEFERRIMWAQDWIQRAKDSITTLETGNFTRTRTAADEFNLSVMASESRDMAERWDNAHRLALRGPRLVALAPPEEQDKLREFLNNQLRPETLASGDPAKSKRAIAALGDRVMGSLEQAQAAADLKRIDAEERLERAQNVKTVAQTELMLLSLGGGWLGAGFAAFQGVSGYMEGGPGEAAKQVLRSFNRATMAACDSMDAYQKSVLDAYEAHAKDPTSGPVDEVRAGLGGAGWVLGKAVALEVGLKYGVAPLGRRLLNIPNPPPKKTLKELAQEMQFLKRRAEGMALVETFENKMGDLAKATKAGASAAEIDRLQGNAETIYKMIKTDWFAKMHLNELGRKGNLTLVRQYNVYDHFAMQQLKSNFEGRQEASGFAQQQYKLFSNSSSAGKAGIDVDLGVVEPPRYILDAAGKQIANPARRQWLDNLATEPGYGKLGLNRWREMSQKNLEAAFKDVYGYDPKKNIGRESFLNFTTSDHAEAYRDLAWLGKKGMKTADIANVDPAWAGQAASVTGFKILDLPNHHPSFGYFATLQEQCRGTVKDIDTKLIPMLGRAKNEAARQHIRALRDVMDKFAKNEIGPFEANRIILEMTGGKGMCEVKDQYAVMLQALTKAK